MKQSTELMSLNSQFDYLDTVMSNLAFISKDDQQKLEPEEIAKLTQAITQAIDLAEKLTDKINDQ